MIGLGSNRLTVCRRGGMSVTKAGRGGMEWLAGYREPSWASPYSAAATAALKAQFPTQWQTIRDYGFAHPEIVGYMNAYAPEDAKIAYSLVPTLGVIRSVYGAGGQYFDSGLKPQIDSYTKLKFLVHSKNNTYPYIFGADSSDRWAAWLDGSQMGLRIGNSSSARPTISVPNSLNKWYELVIQDGKILLNGEQKATYARSNLINYTTFIFGTSTQGNAFGNGAPMDGNIAYFEMDGHLFIPFLRNNAAELLDVTTGNLATKHGSFTISETPTS